MLTVGIIGARRGSSLASAFALQPDCRVVAICDTDQDRAAALAGIYSNAAVYGEVDDLLARPPDMVVVASPVPLHRDHTVAALETGAHVLQEVYLADTIDRCRDIVRAVRSHPRQKFMLAENCCYWGHMMAWRRMYADGCVGKLMYAEAEYVHDVRSLWTNPSGEPTWRAAMPPIHYCSHSLGPLLMITGERCVSATGMAVGPYLSPETKSLDMEAAMLRTESGAVIKLLAAFGIVRRPSFHYYSIYGTGGCLETTRPPAPLSTLAYMQDVEHLHGLMSMPLNYDVPGVPTAAGGHGTAEYLMVRAFVDSIVRDTPPPIGIAQALDMCLPGLVAHESALAGGTPLEIPNLLADSDKE